MELSNLIYIIINNKLHSLYIWLGNMTFEQF